MKPRTARPVGHLCPADPAHGPLVPWTGQPGRSFYCPAAAHDGRPASHPLGAAPSARPFFSIDEVAP